MGLELLYLPDAGDDAGGMGDAAEPPKDASTGALDGTEPLLDASDGDADQPDGGAHEQEASDCAGARVLGLCWYLGAGGENCNEACASHDGFDERSLSLVGLSGQGGSFQACTEVMAGLGQQPPIYGYRTDPYSIGCHVFPDGSSWWLNDASHPFGPEDRYASVRIACACMR